MQQHKASQESPEFIRGRFKNNKIPPIVLDSESILPIRLGRSLLAA
jgi:hypothetical protein